MQVLHKRYLVFVMDIWVDAEFCQASCESSLCTLKTCSMPAPLGCALSSPLRMHSTLQAWTQHLDSSTELCFTCLLQWLPSARGPCVCALHFVISFKLRISLHGGCHVRQCPTTETSCRSESSGHKFIIEHYCTVILI